MIDEIKDGEKSKTKDKELNKPHIVVKNAADYQRLKLEKLMKNPEKPVIIPERPKAKGAPHVPDFVRNVMGSSAGAGSGEFHVYRHLRRKEYARQKYMQERAKRDELDNEYQKKLDENKKLAEERTAKKRAKRLKKKQRAKNKQKKPKVDNNKDGSSSSESSEESGNEGDETDDQKSSVKDSVKEGKCDMNDITQTEHQEETDGHTIGNDNKGRDITDHEDTIGVSS